MDYSLDWALWLPEGDRITALTCTADTGLDVDSSTFTDTTTTVWLSSGTAGATYTVVFHITTDGGREDDRSITIQAKEK